jgi:hypothetical protein
MVTYAAGRASRFQLAGKFRWLGGQGKAGTQVGPCRISCGSEAGSASQATSKQESDEMTNKEVMLARRHVG